MQPTPRYSTLYAVSDLHMGGEPGFQMFAQGGRLADTIDSLPLPGHGAGGPVALVLNGDIVDFLAEPRARYLDPAGAVGKLERIYEDPAFAPVWQALERFIRRDGYELVLVLGNHDVELALPHVREWLADRLSGGRPEARGRIRFHLDGAGFGCEVGGRRVLCLHGNEVDTWNRVDHRQLLEVQRAAHRGKTPAPWDANAGTRLVIDVMNAVKRRYPMVDLLKPETRAVLPILAALDPEPDKLGLMARILRVATVLARDDLFERIGLLSAEAAAGDVGPPGDELLGGLLAETFAGPRDSGGSDPLLQAYRELQAGAGVPVGATARETGMLGIGDGFVDLRDGSAKRELLRRALRRLLDGDDAFDASRPDETFHELVALAGDVDFLIAGHTHLRRALPLVGGGAYFNTGTWARLIELPTEALDDSVAFEAIHDALTAGTLAELDTARFAGQPLVKHLPTAACVYERGAHVIGELVQPGDAPEVIASFSLPGDAR